jgi:signal recognition particle subunit SRP54
MTVTDVNSLVSRFEQAAKMMKTVAKGGVPQIPGMGAVPGMGGGYAGKKKQPQGKGKGAKRSGNPAKRAAEAAGRPAAPSGGGSGFGLGGGAAQPSEADLAQFQQMLGKG